MQTVDASVILDDAYQLMGWDQTQLETRQEQQARMAFSLALQEVWETYWWEELMNCQQVVFQPLYQQGTFYAGNFVYWPLVDGYFQSLGYSQNVDPTDSSGNVNQANWLQWNPFLLWQNITYSQNASNQFGAPGYVYWNADTSFNLGDICQYTITNQSTNLPEVDVFVSTISGNQGNAPIYVENPLLTPLWAQVIQWTPNVKAIGIYGPVRSVTTYDPRQNPAPNQFKFDDNGNVYGLNVGRPWVWSRRVTPVITGDAFDNTVSYTATAANNIV